MQKYNSLGEHGSTDAICEAVSSCESVAVVCRSVGLCVLSGRLSLCKGSSTESVYLRVGIWLVSVVACVSLGVVWECVCLCDLAPVGVGRMVCV